jgi:hypothetical protein
MSAEFAQPMRYGTREGEKYPFAGSLRNTRNLLRWGILLQ